MKMGVQGKVFRIYCNNNYVFLSTKNELLKNLNEGISVEYQSDH